MRSVQDEEIAICIQKIYPEHNGRCGVPRVQATVQREGTRCSAKRVSRLTVAQGLSGETKRKFVVTTDSNHLQPVAENLLARDFSPEQPNRVWASDLTSLPTKESWVYLAITIDL
jgi:putative transposase